MKLWVSNNKYLIARSTYPLATQEGELMYFQVQWALCLLRVRATTSQTVRVRHSLRKRVRSRQVLKCCYTLSLARRYKFYMNGSFFSYIYWNTQVFQAKSWRVWNITFLIYRKYHHYNQNCWKTPQSPLDALRPQILVHVFSPHSDPSRSAASLSHPAGNYEHTL